MKRILTILILSIWAVCATSFSQQWRVVESPSPGSSRNILNGVGFISSNDGWAVGEYDQQPSKSLTMHWNGSDWVHVNSPNPSSQYNVLYSVHGFSSNDVYAVGWSAGIPATPQMMAIHWSGGSWEQMNTPTVTGGSGFECMLAFAPNDIYAGGYKAVGAPGPTTGTLVAHWNGSSWEILTTPNQSNNRSNYITDMKGLSGNDIWAVGYSRVIGENYKAMVIHKTGSDWNIIPVPQPGLENFLYSVDVIAADNIWATGNYNDGTNYNPLFLHYDGNSWTVVNSPGGGWGTIHNSPNDIWSTGSEFVHYDGSAWSLVNSPIPSGSGLNSTAKVSSGDIWSVGYSGGTSTTLIMHFTNSQTYNFSSGNLNKPIVDLGNTYDTLTVFQGMDMSNYIIQDLNVTIDTILHPNAGDLEISLLHMGVTDTLIYQAGGSGDNFTGTVLNDSAAISISNGTAPFTGHFRPAKSLTQFNNLDPSGSWILRVYDRQTGNTGTLQAWSLTFSVINLTAVEPIVNNNPGEFMLFQNYPNPFNPVTKIKFNIPVNSGVSRVNLSVYDILGREIDVLLNQSMMPGSYEVEWNSSGNPSGVYFYTMKAGAYGQTKKMILIK